MIRKIVRHMRRRMQAFMNRWKKAVPVYIPVLESRLLEGRKALITGGTGGIGYAIAKAYVNAGASVVITGRNEMRVNEAVDKLKAECEKSSGIYGLVLDNCAVSNFREKILACAEMLGGLDILVNNAGVVKGMGLGSTQEADYDVIMDTNLKGAYFLSQACASFWREMKNVKANILNVCSASSLRPGQNPYILSKWGLRSLTLELARSYTRDGIVVNAIAPGPTDTDSMMQMGAGGIDWEKNPANRFVTRTEIANLAVVLVSDLSRMVVGDVVYASGGAGVITYDDV